MHEAFKNKTPDPDVINLASVYLTGNEFCSVDVHLRNLKLTTYDRSNLLALEMLICLLLCREYRMTSSIWHLEVK